MAASDPPTDKQLQYLRALAERTGTTFATPTTRRQASEAIDELSRRPAETRATRQHDRRAISDDLATARPDSSVLPDEISGYGSGAHWR
jgi:hypothetical protein